MKFEDLLRIKKGRTIYSKVSMPSDRRKDSSTDLLSLTSAKNIFVEEGET